MTTPTTPHPPTTPTTPSTPTKTTPTTPTTLATPMTPATPATPTTPTRPTTPASGGNDTASDIDIIARAERIRALDRHVARVAWRIFKWALVLGVVVVPVATCLFVPHGFMRQPCRSKQSEAKGNLKALYVAEESYRAEHDSYIVNQQALEWRPRGQRIRYEYFVKVEGSNAFAAYAVGVDEETIGDLWRITQNNDLSHLVNACAF